MEKFSTRNDISAVVIRIDSPGGLVAPTQEIYEKIKSLSDLKPVIASMATVAASGGYYISCQADKILADESTVTGSIGVIWARINFSKLTWVIMSPDP